MNGIDCASKLNLTTATAIKKTGVDAVGRYLGRTSWKGLTPDEVKAIQDSGLSLYLIWETSPTKPSYFYYNKGVSDARSAIVEAEFLGAPHGVAIYFAVDYDAQPADMKDILEYFRGVKDGMACKYLVGVYGSYSVCNAVDVDRYYQTYAWSKGLKFNAHIYQYKNGTTAGGVQVDQDTVNEGSGLWRKEVITVETTVNDPDVNCLVWVRESKLADAIKAINALGFACEPLPLPLSKINK